MKKLNLTPGEWYVDQSGNWCDIVSQHDFLDSKDIICQKVRNEDAQAISAVPDMIKALIAVYEFEKNTNALDPETSIAVSKALEKAGVL